MTKKNKVKVVKKNPVKKSSIKKNRIIHRMTSLHKDSTYKKGLLEVDTQENKYDRLFEQKLAQQYREFRNIKEHHLQLKKVWRIIGIIVVIVLVALLLFTFR